MLIFVEPSGGYLKSSHSESFSFWSLSAFKRKNDGNVQKHMLHCFQFFRVMTALGFSLLFFFFFLASNKMSRRWNQWFQPRLARDAWQQRKCVTMWQLQRGSLRTAEGTNNQAGSRLACKIEFGVRTQIWTFQRSVSSVSLLWQERVTARAVTLSCSWNHRDQHTSCLL